MFEGFFFGATHWLEYRRFAKIMKREARNIRKLQALLNKQHAQREQILQMIGEGEGTK